MARLIKLLITISVIILMTSCAAQYEKYYVFDKIDSQNIQQCVTYCQTSKDRCLSRCQSNGSLCKKDAVFSAKSNDKRYPLMSVDSDLVFDPAQCLEMQCDCDRDYRACYQLCGGVVKTLKRCIANCPKGT